MILLDYIPIAARLKSNMTTVGRIVRMRGDRDLKSKFGTEFPAVYLLRQMQRPLSPGNGSGQVRIQIFDVELTIAMVAQKYVDRDPNNQLAIANLYDDVTNVLHGWTPPGMDMSFWTSGVNDGDPADTVNYVELKLMTRYQYRRAP